MNLEEYNLGDRENGAGRGSYARSETSEGISEASSLPIGDAQAPVQLGNIVAPGGIKKY
jgi:hypothetical protein